MPTVFSFEVTYN